MLVLSEARPLPYRYSRELQLCKLFAVVCRISRAIAVHTI